VFPSVPTDILVDVFTRGVATLLCPVRQCYTQAKRVLCFEDILQARSATNWLAPVADRRLYRNLDHVGRRLFLTCLAPTCSTRQHICESCSSVVTTSIFEVASKIWYPRPHWAYDKVLRRVNEGCSSTRGAPETHVLPFGSRPST
jgi:hypothetical protein